MIRRYIAATLLAALPALVGCANYTTPVVATEPLTPQQRNFEETWQAGLELLRQYHFTADPLRGGAQDRREGVIRSAPEVGKHWFEFWRKDAATNYDLAEGTLQTIYRQVTIRIKPAGAANYTAQIEVQTFRSDRAVRYQDHSWSSIYSMFQVPGQSTDERQILLNEPRENPNTMIVPLGRNPALEAKMTDDLLRIRGQRQAAR